jgi:hypothetical protein
VKQRGDPDVISGASYIEVVTCALEGSFTPLLGVWMISRLSTLTAQFFKIVPSHVLPCTSFSVIKSDLSVLCGISCDI